MRIFFIIVGICFVWLSSVFYVSNHPLSPLLIGDILIQREGNAIYLPFLTSVIAGVLVLASLYIVKKITPLLHKAPGILLGVMFIFIAVLGWYGYQLRSGLYVCNSEYQPSLDTLKSQSQTVLANQKDGCTQSYTLLTDWNMCVENAEGRVPLFMQSFLQPTVSNIMMFFREKTKDIEVLKREHDERCIGYTELLFYPPNTE